MNPALKSRLLGDNFVSLLYLEDTFDRAAYDVLRQDLLLLAEEWRSETAIDKEVMSEIYIMPNLTRNMAAKFPELQWDIEEMAIELDGLIMECLCCNPNYDRTLFDFIASRTE